MVKKYPQGDYALSIPHDFQVLLVTPKKGGKSIPFPLDKETKVTLEGDEYVVKVGSLSGNYHEKDFNPDEMDLTIVPEPFRFRQQEWIGTSDIRDLGRLTTHYHYNLNTCTVSLAYLSATQFQVRASCKGGCTDPQACFTVKHETFPS